MLHLVLILLSLSDVLTQDTDWRVNYTDNQICAVRGFSVSIPCSYYYPTSNPIQVTEMLWCSMNLNTGRCTSPPYVYNSALNTKSDFEFTGDDKSDCTLLIQNVQFNYSGEYKFRFITDVDKWTGDPGVTLQVTDLKVSLIGLSGNGTFKPGDSLNLTCDVNCTQSSSQFVWSKNNELLPESGAVLHFPALTLRDSGKYTCTWKTSTTSGSKTISLQVEGNNLEDPESPEDPELWLIWIIVSVIAGVIVIVTVISGAVIYKRRRVHAEDDSNLYTNVKQKKSESDHHGNIRQKKSESDHHGNIQQKKSESDHHGNIRQKKSDSDHHGNIQQKKSESDHHGNIQQKKSDSDHHGNIQQKKSESDHHGNIQQKKSDSDHHGNIRQKKSDSDHHGNIQQKKSDSDHHGNIQQKCGSDHHGNIQQKKSDSDHHGNIQQTCDSDYHCSIQQKQDVSDIYANVKMEEDNFNLYANVS
ncbi:hypothetical protein C0J50_0528 [Silurus asotus]|uniref:Ig-like domain-containing protein n=1 Tax=Silurus asotus TaxID=30991 RepID=A0AAD5FCN7_SILAS|nr:hypothetical protein C0J50_0528 [Silurus asotus]